MSVFYLKQVVITLFFTFCLFHYGLGSIVDRDLTLTSSEKAILDKLKDTLEPLVKDAKLKKEVYLIRWLRATNFDLHRSKEMLLEHIKWRKSLKMDTIHEEDWSDFESAYEYNVDSVDKDGKPLVIFPFGQWDFRSAILSGNRDKLERYIYKMLDDAEKAIQKEQKEGKFVTRTDLLVNIEGFNTVQHACVQCLTLYVSLARALDSHFPFLYEKMILLNTPSIFEIVLNLVKPVMVPSTRDSIVVYGSNKREWQNILLKTIDEDQLPFEYGGTKLPNYF